MAASALAALALAVVATSASARPPYVQRHGPYRANPRFAVTYVGAGAWRTRYHANPPNEGGDPDTEDARDSSSQAWLLAFSDAFRVPRCGPRPAGDACAAASDLDGATGPTRATGRIDHTHVDGLYPQLDAEESCNLEARTPADGSVGATLAIRYLPGSKSFAMTALEPVGDVLLNVPNACPNHTDPIDLLLDNYFGPAFSFDPAFDAARWFRSPTVVLPAHAFHHAAELMVPLHETAAGTPPSDCAVRHPEYERCRTRGAWNGVLIFARGGGHPGG